MDFLKKRFWLQFLITAGVVLGLAAAIWFIRDLPYWSNAELAVVKLTAVVIAFFGLALWFQRFPLTWKEVLVLSGVGLSLLSFTLFFRHSNLRDVEEHEMLYLKLSVIMVVLIGFSAWAIRVKKRV